ncbi:MAG: AbrB/MazE/SpoVT family DNA-binding domain-containing protein [Nitrospirae bacterium]|nr:AbrB/MazE/SpoVT family DNA-binding domain-containing protein [Nitrospirota bacterium]
MKTVTVSPKGRVAIPEDVRAHLNIQAGDTLVVSVEDGKLVMEPATSIPDSQAWFWTKEVQEQIKETEENFGTGNFERYTIDEFVKLLTDRDRDRS